MTQETMDTKVTLEIVELVDAIKSVAIAIDRFHDKARRLPAVEWLQLNPGDDSGMIRISEISSIVRLVDVHGIPSKVTMRDKGVEIILKSGKTITAPDADYGEVKLAVFGWEMVSG